MATEGSPQENSEIPGGEANEGPPQEDNKAPGRLTNDVTPQEGNVPGGEANEGSQQETNKAGGAAPSMLESAEDDLAKTEAETQQEVEHWAAIKYDPTKCQDSWNAPPQVAFGMAQDMYQSWQKAKALEADSPDGSAVVIKSPAGCTPLGNVQGVPVLEFTVGYSAALLLFAYFLLRCFCCKKKNARKKGVYSAAEDEGVEMTNRVVVGGVVQEFMIGEQEEDDPFGLDNDEEDREQDFNSSQLLNEIDDALGGEGEDEEIDWEKIEVV